MKFLAVIPSGMINYARLIRNKIKFQDCTIESSFLGGNLNLGKNVSLANNVRTHGDSSIGSFSYVNSNTMIFSSVIGNFCSIANDCKIGSIEHPIGFVSTNPFTFSNENIFGLPGMWESNKKTTLGNDVWVGNNVNIMAGVTIGDGVIIGAGAVVTKDLPPYSVAVGVPAKIIKYRFEEDIIEGLIETKWWNKDADQLRLLGPFFELGENGPEALIKYLREEKM